MNDIYDIIILGGGPAGLSAGLYAGRARLRTLIIEKSSDGGQLLLTNSIENYPGQLSAGETGADLVARMSEQAARFGAERCADTIQSVELSGTVKTLTGQHGVYQARSVIIATGTTQKPLGCENEQKFIGQGISYCATCDAAFFRGLPVYVAGGGDSAVEEALYLTRFARQVTIIHRRDALRAAKSLQDKAFAEPKISFLWDSVIEKADGEGVLSRLTVRNVKTDVRSVLAAEPADGMLGLFVFIGSTPNTALFAGQLTMQDGYILTDEAMRTGIQGVYAAGDVRLKSVRQAVTAAADGAAAAVTAGREMEAVTPR